MDGRRVGFEPSLRQNIITVAAAALNLDSGSIHHGVTTATIFLISFIYSPRSRLIRRDLSYL